MRHERARSVELRRLHAQLPLVDALNDDRVVALLVQERPERLQKQLPGLLDATILGSRVVHLRLYSGPRSKIVNKARAIVR
jgi:hypothetical protein